MPATIKDVKQFWEENPLWSGESQYAPGTPEFFHEHRQAYLQDCFAGEMDERIMPDIGATGRVLDLGCGPGFWTVELAEHGCTGVSAVDLTFSALQLAQKRLALNGRTASLSTQNAEALGFADGVFDHVNCQGVIHHTPDTEACVREIARVLVANGTGLISVYYRNVYIRNWSWLKWAGKIVSLLGSGMRGRGRENIYTVSEVDDLVRLFDGEHNPIGKCYSRVEFQRLLQPYFNIEQIFFHFFPARTLPFRVPRTIHKFLDRHSGFLIFAKITKRAVSAAASGE